MINTNKHTIIDEVDVIKCEYYKEYSDPNEDGDEYNDICECSITESAFCFDKCNSNCYYKQLKRKEQECEALGQAYLETNELLQEKTKECTNLKAEKDELKHQIEDVDTLCSEKESLIDKYLKTLTDIKEICKTNVCKHCHSKLKVDDNYCKNIENCDCYKILQKIRECE